MDVCLASILAAIAYQIVIEEKVPKFLFFNFLNMAVFCGVLVMGYAIGLSQILFRLDENKFYGTVKKITKNIIPYYNLLYLIILIDLYIFYVLDKP